MQTCNAVLAAFPKVTTLQIDGASLLSTNDVKCSLCVLLVAFANLVRLQVRVRREARHHSPSQGARGTLG